MSEPTPATLPVEMRPLRTPLVTLEPLVAAHAAGLFPVLSDPAIYQFEGAPPESEDRLRERYRRLEARGPADGRERWLNWAVRTPEGALAGYVQATVRHDGSAFIAYELGSAFWRRGLGSAAVRAMVDELAGHHGTRTLLAVLKTANHRSTGLLRHLGFGPAPEALATALCDGPDESLMWRAARPPETA